MPTIPALEMLKREDYKFEVSLGHRVGSWLALAI